jgi:hypothetical protein
LNINDLSSWLLKIGVKGLFFDDMIGWMMAGCVLAEKEGDQQNLAYTIGEMLGGLASFLALSRHHVTYHPPSQVPQYQCFSVDSG